MLSCSVHNDVEQKTWIVEVAAVKVDSRCNRHERIVFLLEIAVKGEESGVIHIVLKNIDINESTAAMNITHKNSRKCRSEGTTKKPL